MQNKPLRKAPSYGFVNISVADIRKESNFQSEMVNQTIMGSIVTILDAEKNFFLIKNWDGYRGWISRQAIITTNEHTIEQWQNSDKIIVTENYGEIFSKPDHEAEPVSDLVAGIILNRKQIGAKYTTVQLPNLEIGYIYNSIIEDLTEHQKIRVSSLNIIAQARKLMGIPYLWGGTSTKGFDCSGFVQTVFRLLNAELPRDSQQMATIGTTVPIKNGSDFLKEADLLFFGEEDQKIDHVGIFIGDELYIHCRGKVRISSLNPENHLYEGDALLKVKRIAY
jgi:hypothetical protein